MEDFISHEYASKFRVKANDLLKHVEPGHSSSRSRSVNYGRDDSNFYRSLAQKISENLLFYVDGKPKLQQNIGCNNNGQINEVKTFPESTISKLNLEDYNFPSDYQLNDNEELDKIHYLDYELKNCLSSNRDTNEPDENLSLVHEDDKPINTCLADESESLVYLCDACGNHFPSLSSFNEHEINNHPNVFCSYTEVQLNQNIPANVFLWHHYSPTGLLKTCKVPQIVSSSSEPSIKCTKCHNKFITVVELYQHIIDCSSSSSMLSYPSPASSESATPNKINNHAVNSNGAFSSYSLSPSSSSSSISTSISSSPSSSPLTVPSSPSTSNDLLEKVQQSTNSISSSVRKNNSTRAVNNNFSISYNTRSSNKRKLHDGETPRERKKIIRKFKHRDSASNGRVTKGRPTKHPVLRGEEKTGQDVNNNCVRVARVPKRSLAMLKRARRPKYHCPNCSGIFNHHLTFAKHRSSCPPSDDANIRSVNSSDKLDTPDFTSRNKDSRDLLNHRKVDKLKRKLRLRENENTANKNEDVRRRLHPVQQCL